MILKFASLKSVKFFNPKKMNKKDKYRYLKNNNLKNSLDFKVSRTILGFSKKKFNYSISHKNGNAIVGFSKRKIGVDLEEIKERQNLDDLFLFFSTQEEQKIFFNLQGKEKLYFFYEIFTFKEALIKIERKDFSIAQSRNILEYNFSFDKKIPTKVYHTSIVFHCYFPISCKYQNYAPKDFLAYFLITIFKNKKYMICCIEGK